MKKIVEYFLIIFILNGSFLTIECFLWNNGPPRLKLATYIVKYFNLDKLETPIDNFNDGLKHFSNRSNSKCDSINSIEDYFFEVYGSQLRSKTQFTVSDIDDLIHYHLKRTRKPNNEHNHEKYKCERQTV